MRTIRIVNILFIQLLISANLFSQKVVNMDILQLSNTISQKADHYIDIEDYKGYWTYNLLYSKFVELTLFI